MLQFTLLALLFVVLGVYLWLRHLHRYWTRRGLPQADTCLLFGNLLDAILARKNQGVVYDEIYREFLTNDAVGFFELTTPKLMVRSPALIQRVLVSDFSSFHDNECFTSERLDPYLACDAFVMRGDQWKKARNSLIPAVTVNKVKDMYQLMLQTVPLMVDYIDNHQDNDLEAKVLASQFIMTNVSNSVFGVVNNCFTDPNSHFRKMADMLSKGYWGSRLSVLVIFYLPRVKELLGVRFLPGNVSKYVEDMIKHVVHERLANNIRRTDFLQYYLDQKKSEREILFEAIGQGQTFFIAGMETSSNPAACAVYELGMNQVIQDALHEELEDAFRGKKDLEFDTLVGLPYLDNVVQETMRKYPILFSASKMCTKTTRLQIDDREVQIEAGTPVMVPVYSVSHDPQYYPDPEVFDPERFNEENKAARTPFTYMPFGEGPRMCPGMKFGLTQIKLFLANLFHRYRVVPCWKTPSKLTFEKSAIFLLPAEQLWLRFEKR